MKTFFKKELIELLSSPISFCFGVSFLLASSMMNWSISGNYNILEGGYATMDKFFALAPILLIVLIPALTMRSFSEEKRSKTLEIIRSKPISLSTVYLNKIISAWTIATIVILTTTIYVATIYYLSLPMGHIDTNAIIASYISIFLIVGMFITIGVFASSLTNNQMLAFIIGLFLNLFFFYGFELISNIFTSAAIQNTIASAGISSHYKLMQKGVFQLRGILLLLNYISIPSILAIYFLNHKSRKGYTSSLVSATVLICINLLILFLPNYRFDFTIDKRYTLSEYSKEQLQLLSTKNEKIDVKIYLEGDLNSGFQRLRTATQDIILDFNRHSDNSFSYEFINPQKNKKSQEDIYKQMEALQMRGIILNEIDNEGKSSQKIIYPYAQIIHNQDTAIIPLLKNIAGYNGEENLNISIENLEFEFMNAIRLLNKKDVQAIAFIEGHGELDRAFVYDAEELLSKYYSVHRGVIENDMSILDNFRVVIIAGPTQAFTETEKFILDQYIMAGGRVLWLIDGVYISHEELLQQGESPSMRNNTNLDDLLFTYGIRINPVLLQDTQCSSISISNGDNTSTTLSWYYAPVLLPSADHVVTENTTMVKAEMVSSVDIMNRYPTNKKNILLTTGQHSHIVQVPEMIRLDVTASLNTPNYFNQSFIPTAVAIEGVFQSAFANRPQPENIDKKEVKAHTESQKTKMIAVGSSDIIRNQLIGKNEQTQILPMGYDILSNKQYGNREFIVNAVNWLANDDQWMLLRSKQQELYLLNKKEIYENGEKYRLINILTPILLITIIIGIVNLRRYLKYRKG